MAENTSKASVTTLAITAHPDDIDIAAGGTIAKWVQQGDEVYYCIVTDGDAGSPEPKITSKTIATLRQHEQEDAAKLLGVKSVFFLSFPDGRLSPSTDLRIDLATVIRKIKPQRVLTHSPIYNFKSIRYSHPDHLAVGRAVLAAVFPDARNPHAFRESNLVNFEPHTVESVWMMGTPNPNTYIDITAEINTKIDAIACHASQLSDFGDIKEFFYTWGQELAVDAGFSNGLLAEAFYVMDTR